jgi:hypothetical protein
MSEPTAEAGLFAKIAAVMGEVGRVEKRGRNTFQNYDYVTEADLVEAVREKLAHKNVALIPSLASVHERPYTTSGNKESVVTTAHVSFTFVDGDSGAMFKADWAGQGDDPADKGLYSAYTGALKYFLMKTFLIPTGDDPEGREGTDERSQDRASSGPRRSNSRTAGKPSDAQLALVKTMVQKKKPTLDQLKVILREIGSDADPNVAGWSEKLTAGREGTASLLITYLKEKPLPSLEHPSDLPDDGFEEAPKQEGEEVPFA